MEGISLLKALKTRGGDCYFKCKDSNTKLQGTWKNQGNMTPPKDHNNIPVDDPKDMEIWDLPNKKFK